MRLSDQSLRLPDQILRLLDQILRLRDQILRLWCWIQRDCSQILRLTGPKGVDDL